MSWTDVLLPMVAIVVCGVLLPLGMRRMAPAGRRRSLWRTVVLGVVAAVWGATLGTLAGGIAGADGGVAVWLVAGALIGGAASVLVPPRRRHHQGQDAGAGVSRRKALAIVGRIALWGGVAAGTAASGATGTAAWFWARAVMSNVGTLSFKNRLRIPPLAEPSDDEPGRPVFDLTLQTGQTSFRDGEQTDTWGVNGAYLGPTLRARRGDNVAINVTNTLGEMTTMHWHGMHLPAVMDGGPHQPIEPDSTWTPTWTIDQPAATLWYHPHPHGETADHVYRGVAGLFILDDDAADASGLPHEYGVDDIPVIIQDRSFNGDGSFRKRQNFLSNVGVLGDEILVNGTHDPHLPVTTNLVRLRLLNASNARIYHVGFDDDRPFHLVATDSGLVEQPVELTRVPLSPGERAEIVVEVAAHDRPILRSHRYDLGDVFNGRMQGGDDTFDILQLRAADELAAVGNLPGRLPITPHPDESAATATRPFRMSGTNINGLDMDMTRVDVTVPAGAIEIWEIENTDGVSHNFHVHGVSFVVLDVDGAEPPTHLGGWKDTVLVPAGGSARILIPFGTSTDANSPFMFHCHLLRHEDRGMMGQYVVVEPGSEPVTQFDAVPLQTTEGWCFTST